MKGTSIAIFASIALFLAGCGKKDETTTTTTTPSTATTGTMTPSTPTAPLPDFSSDAQITATVIPMLQEKIQADTVMAGSNLKMEVKDKTIHIMGDVTSNEQKRKIDEITKTMEPAATAAGYKFMNMAIVKG